jgi:hypothetical protein
MLSFPSIGAWMTQSGRQAPRVLVIELNEPAAFEALVGRWLNVMIGVLNFLLADQAGA